MTEGIPDLGRKIKTIREELGYSQRELARSLSITRSMINKIERNEQRPQVEFLIKFASFCNISVDELLGLRTPGPVFLKLNRLLAALEEDNNREKRKALIKEIQELVRHLEHEISSLKNDLQNLITVAREV